MIKTFGLVDALRLAGIILFMNGGSGRAWQAVLHLVLVTLSILER